MAKTLLLGVAISVFLGLAASGAAQDYRKEEEIAAPARQAAIESREAARRYAEAHYGQDFKLFLELIPEARVEVRQRIAEKLLNQSRFQGEKNEFLATFYDRISKSNISFKELSSIPDIDRAVLADLAAITGAMKKQMEAEEKVPISEKEYKPSEDSSHYSYCAYELDHSLWLISNDGFDRGFGPFEGSPGEKKVLVRGLGAALAFILRVDSRGRYSIDSSASEFVRHAVKVLKAHDKSLESGDVLMGCLESYNSARRAGLEEKAKKLRIAAVPESTLELEKLVWERSKDQSDAAIRRDRESEKKAGLALLRTLKKYVESKAVTADQLSRLIRELPLEVLFLGRDQTTNGSMLDDDAAGKVLRSAITGYLEERRKSLEKAINPDPRKGPEND